MYKSSVVLAVMANFLSLSARPQWPLPVHFEIQAGIEETG